MSDSMRVSLPRVLIVDDEKQVADAYALRMEGVADTTIAYSGAEALSTVDPSDPPDVVLLDRHMPGLSGDEVLTELRGLDARMRVIMITAIDPQLAILELPFDEYLCKPVETDTSTASPVEIRRRTSPTLRPRAPMSFASHQVCSDVPGVPAAKDDANLSLTAVRTIPSSDTA